MPIDPFPEVTFCVLSLLLCLRTPTEEAPPLCRIVTSFLVCLQDFEQWVNLQVEGAEEKRSLVCCWLCLVFALPHSMVANALMYMLLTCYCRSVKVTVATSLSSAPSTYHHTFATTYVCMYITLLSVCTSHFCHNSCLYVGCQFKLLMLESKLITVKI